MTDCSQEWIYFKKTVGCGFAVYSKEVYEMIFFPTSSLSSPSNTMFSGAKAQKECNRCGYCMDLASGPDPSLKIQQISVKNLPRVKTSIAVWISLNTTKVSSYGLNENSEHPDIVNLV